MLMWSLTFKCQIYQDYQLLLWLQEKKFYCKLLRTNDELLIFFNFYYNCKKLTFIKLLL